MSLQVAILKVLASHDSGRATLASLKRDIAVLSASGAEWSARIKRLAARVAAIDIFGCGYVLRDAEGWQITAAGREFLDALEAVTQDNQPPVPVRRSADVPEASVRPEGALIVIGHRFKSRIGRHREAAPRNPRAI
ncbi:aminoacyl-tRNA deacylase [Bradyrhizobium sp.]|uniref:aminoacyl-tRNA deacylase n=1 Tax=Bradyrhizobium sp. TaxID=376 RepID=UPI0027376C1A|nr:aminoacyl-tRNA deacylase [Bradyrhizobium sp.]MDP3691606.1 aminoacyl-tRNA deacylase [Bradyrhizobium sp.]